MITCLHRIKNALSVSLNGRANLLSPSRCFSLDGDHGRDKLESTELTERLAASIAGFRFS